MAVRERVRQLMDERISRQPSWILLVEVFIGLGWLRAAVSKTVSRDWWRGDVIRDFVSMMGGNGLPWWEPFLDGVVLVAPAAVAAVVLAGQYLAGTTLLLGRRLGVGLTVGMTMNLAFVLTGAVDPSVFYLISQAVVALWLYETHVTYDTGRRWLRGYVVAAVVVATTSAAFIRTLDPMQVTEDPATVLTTYAVTVGVASWVALRRLERGEAGLLAVEVGADRVVRDRVARGEVVPPLRGEGSD